MSAIHERRYRLQREREIAQTRVRETTAQYLQRYEQILHDLSAQDLQQYVSIDVQELKAQLLQLSSGLQSDAFQARELSLQIGQRIHALPRLARQARDIAIENERLEVLERERQAQEQRRKEHEKLEQAWQLAWSNWTDKWARNLALNELSELRKCIFVENSPYTAQQIEQEMAKIQQSAEQKVAIKRQQVEQDAQHEATQTLTNQLMQDIKVANLPVAMTEQLTQQITAALQQPETMKARFQALVQQADQAMVDESVRREMVKAVCQSLKHAGFTVLSPTRSKDEHQDVVLIQAKRPSGNQARFKIELDGKVRYEFDSYKGQACKEDMQQVLPRLEDVYGVNLSEERVIWSNPDDEHEDMKPITPNNTEKLKTQRSILKWRI